jgi:hypothetical protein
VGCANWLDPPVRKTILCNPLDKNIREKLNQRLRGLEYRQQAREQQRAARQKAYRIASMMREQGTLRGARKYLEIKGIPFRESVDPATGNRELTIPGQITLSYDPQGKFLRSRPPALSVGG